MKTKDQAQRAHDMLVGVVLGEIPITLLPSDKEALLACASVLCWVLDHQHSNNFQVLLKALEEKFTELGFALEDRSN